MVFVEKELKILEVNAVEIILGLEKLGATKNYDKTLYDVYFDTHAGCLGKDRKNLRVRFAGDEHLITMKSRLPSRDYKAAIEKEYHIQGQDLIDQATDHGLAPQWAKYKRRISYQYENIVFDMDLYPGMPPVLEIEALSLKDIRRGIKLLGLEQKRTATCGARGLFRRYNRAPEKIFGNTI